jgi:hypothetical protein
MEQKLLEGFLGGRKVEGGFPRDIKSGYDLGD